MRLSSFLVLMLVILIGGFAYITRVVNLSEVVSGYGVVFSAVALEEICVKLEDK